MNEVIVVAVSYYYGGRGWTDPYTNIDFKANEKGLPVVISKDKDLRGIKRSVRLNNLMLLEGDLDTSGENTLEKIDPAELTQEQLEKLVGAPAEGSEELQAQIDKLTKEKKALEESNKTLTSEKAANEKKIKELESQIATLTSQLEKANQAKTTAESKLSTEEKNHKKTKDKMFAIHKFTNEELQDAYFTVAILKEIMTTKSIAFEGGDNKSQLIEKLLAGQSEE